MNDMSDTSPRYYGHLMVSVDHLVAFQADERYVIPVDDDFTRWLAGRDRAVHADALRAAADALSSIDLAKTMAGSTGAKQYFNESTPTFIQMVQDAITNWLRENADAALSEGDYGHKEEN